jgi:glucuronoarabinoxylan endo-1,4-beta-xylanase
MIKILNNLFFLSFILMSLFSCGKKEEELIPEIPQIVPNKVTADPGIEHQEMIGFGAALTWWSDRVITSSKREEIYQLMFEDLGMDILRLKNWYYPSNYPLNKSPEIMDNYEKTMYNASNIFYNKAKEYNPNIKILLSSWGPPISLKDNNHLRTGTLKKDGNRFMYDEFAQYWVDLMDNLPFSPDYLSIQNEPGYVNANWTTCMWAPTETSTLPGFDQALDKINHRLKDRQNVPLLLAPETENATAFNNFMPPLQSKDYLKVVGYHPYNFNESTPLDQMNSFLNNVKSLSGNKPNIMTEYSNMSWFKTARFIHRNLTIANTSGYIYWELVWGDANRTEYPMINIDGSGNYTVTGFYHLIKHFSKFIDVGYKRIGASSNIGTLEVSAYINPEKSRITYVFINPDATERRFEIAVKDKTIKNMKAFQSLEGNFYKEIPDLKPDSKILIRRNSVTTIVVEI